MKAKKDFSLFKSQLSSEHVSSELSSETHLKIHYRVPYGEARSTVAILMSGADFKGLKDQ